MGIFHPPRDPKVWKRLIYEHFLSSANAASANLALIGPLKSFSRLPYVSECEWSAVITEFKFENEGLGNKQPRQGKPRKPFCPVCPVKVANCGFHLLFCCSSLSKLRAETGITSFMTMCTLKGLTMLEAYSMFVNGEDSDKSQVSVSNYLERGRCMHDMRKLWFSKW